LWAEIRNDPSSNERYCETPPSAALKEAVSTSPFRFYYAVAQPAATWSNLAYILFGIVMLVGGTEDGARWTTEQTTVFAILNMVMGVCSFLFHAFPAKSPVGRLDGLSMWWIITYLLIANIVLLSAETDAWVFWVAWGVVAVLAALFRCTKLESLDMFAFLVVLQVATSLAVPKVAFDVGAGATERELLNGWLWASIGTILVSITIWWFGQKKEDNNGGFTEGRALCRPGSGRFSVTNHNLLCQAHSLWHFGTALAFFLLYFFYSTN